MDMKDDNDMSVADSEFEFDMDDDNWTVELRQTYFFAQWNSYSLRKELKTIIV